MNTQDYFTKCLFKLSNDKDKKWEDQEDKVKDTYKEVATKFSNIVLQRVQYEELKKQNDEIVNQLEK